MSDKYRVTFDSATEQALIVHASKGPVRFVRVTSNLYAFIPPYASPEARQRAITLLQSSPKITGVTLMDTVEERKTQFTPQQIKCLKCDQISTLPVTWVLESPVGAGPVVR